MTQKRRKYLGAALLFLLGFGLALAAGRWWSGMGAPPPESAATVGTALRGGELEAFLQAVGKGDYPVIKEMGEALFRPGVRVADDAARLLAQYAVNSTPPYAVYALYTFNDPDTTRRVLLTLDDHDRVESFLAEEMAVIK